MKRFRSGELTEGWTGSNARWELGLVLLGAGVALALGWMDGCFAAEPEPSPEPRIVPVEVLGAGFASPRPPAS